MEIKYYQFFNCVGQDIDMERLNKLAAFQRKALQHAFLCELVHFFLLPILFYVCFRLSMDLISGAGTTKNLAFSFPLL
jgi:hypothetical protein